MLKITSKKKLFLKQIVHFYQHNLYIQFNCVSLFWGYDYIWNYDLTELAYT